MNKSLNRKNEYRRFWDFYRKKWILIGIISCCIFGTVFGNKWHVLAAAEEKIQEPTEVYAQSAVLMDADSGRILFEKEGKKERAMASTTKIMTCILALEEGNLDQEVAVSEQAASQPKVKLGMCAGDCFSLRDLLYSLMLESHNDSAVAIAETVGGSVEAFADMMNAKAEKIGCMQTHFVTPNGLDEEDEEGSHHTTAEELAKIMKYCTMDSTKKEAFLEITQTENYSFTDRSGKKQFSCQNHNAFLQMMKGAISGKTGFTAEAGYCYVGALESEGRTFIVALLACGWPNHKSYKWADTKKLMTYGMESYHFQQIEVLGDYGKIYVEEGVPEKGKLQGSCSLKLIPDRKSAEGMMKEIFRLEENEAGEGQVYRILLRDDEAIQMKKSIKKYITAPVEKGTEVGTLQLFLENEKIGSCKLITADEAQKRDFCWCLKKIVEYYLMF